MTTRSIRSLVADGCRRLVVLLCAVVYLISTIGFPVPTRNAAISASYPCAGRGCGCDSEEQCRRACCCFKPALVEEEPACSACCEQERAKVETGAGIRWVSGVQERQCQGMMTLWLMSASGLPAPEPMQVDPDQTVWSLFSRVPALPCSPVIRPRIPPPRLGRTEAGTPLSQQAGCRCPKDEPVFRCSSPAGHCGEC